MSSTITQPAVEAEAKGKIGRARYLAQLAHPADLKKRLDATRAKRTLKSVPLADGDAVAGHPISSISDAGVAFIASFEGFRSAPYWDALGRCWTIGFGETHGITAHTPPVTRADALAKLR